MGTWRLRGSCHCRGLAVSFCTKLDPRTLPLRACQCSFCRRHGARTVTDPAGHVRVIVRDSMVLGEYEFGERAARFLMCKRCGIYLAAMVAAESPTPGNALGMVATLNVNVLERTEAFDREATPISYEGET